MNLRNLNKDATDKIIKLTNRLEELGDQFEGIDQSQTDSQEDVATPDGSILNDKIEEAHNLEEGDIEDEEVKIPEEPSTPKSAKNIKI